MTSSIIVRKEEDIGEIDPTSISRSVFVFGLKAATTSDDLIIHFQKRRNGGGDIDSIIISKKGKAVITFDEPGVVSSLLQHKQEFDGMVLTVVPYLDVLVRKSDQSVEMFELVSAELCLEFVEYLSRQKIKALLNKIEARIGIKWMESSDTFIISGTLKQVEEAHTFLQDNASQFNGIVVSNYLKGNESPSEGPESPIDDEVGTQEDVSQNRSPALAANKEIRRHGGTENGTQNDSKDYSEFPKITSFSEIQPKILNVFVKAYKKELQDIEARYHVEIPRKAEKKTLSLKPKDSCKAEDYERACNEFISLYQSMYQQVKMQRFSLKSETKVINARSAISKIDKTFAVSVEFCKDKKHWVLYGEASQIEEALKFLEKERIEINREKEDAADEKGRWKKVKDVEEDVDPETSSGGKSPGDRLETFIGGRIKLSVYKDDLTKQRVDVIVNAANGRLQHDGGVAAAILAKGGEKINEESRAIIRRRSCLKDGDAVTTNSGKLPCKAIIHAVGPRWSEQKERKSKTILRRACLNSFTEAEKMDFTSIALPAIGSGTYGMPKEVCAEVMFKAVDEFLRQGDAKEKKITDIRFVNIDEPSVQAFKKEFRNRYGDDVESSSREKETGGNTSRLSNSTAETEVGSSTMLRSARGMGQSKDNRPSKNPTDVGISQYDYSSFGTSAANSYHPLMDPSGHLSTKTSYSNAVKGHTYGQDTRMPKDQQSQENGAKEGFSLPLKEGDGVDADQKDEEICPICRDRVSSPKSLKCKHSFCPGCIQKALNVCNKCPVCQQPQGVIKGNQPPGEMTFRTGRYSVPGYEGNGQIIIDYYFPPGVQGPEHPNPGQRYYGTSCTAYLPDTREGREVLQLLGRAFHARLVFTVGTSSTTGLSNQVIWNDIHHKTNVYGGPHGYGYPDPDYLRRVKEELAAKGIR